MSAKNNEISKEKLNESKAIEASLYISENIRRYKKIIKFITS